MTALFFFFDGFSGSDAPEPPSPPGLHGSGQSALAGGTGLRLRARQSPIQPSDARRFAGPLTKAGMAPIRKVLILGPRGKPGGQKDKPMDPKTKF